MRRHLGVIALTVLITACAGNTRSSSGVQPAGDPSTPEPVPHQAGECTLIDLGSMSDLLLELTPLEPSHVESLRLWTIERNPSDDEVASFDSSDVLVQGVRLDRILLVRDGSLSENVVDEVVEGAEMRSLRTLADEPLSQSLTVGVPLLVLATVWESDSGRVLRVTATFSPDGNLLDAGRCTGRYRETLLRLGAGVSVVERLVRETHVSPDLTREISEIERTVDVEPLSAAEYELEWSRTPADQRGLQVGQVPSSLRPEIRLTGLFIEVAPQDLKGMPRQYAVWSSLGVSHEVVLPAGAGPAPLVVPLNESLHISERLEGGQLGSPIATVPPGAEDSFLLVVARDGAMTMSWIPAGEFSWKTGISDESLEIFRTDFESRLFYDQ